MDALLALVLLALVMPWILTPLARRAASKRKEGRDGREPEAEGLALGDLEAQRDARLRELAELQIDRQLGKLEPSRADALERALRAELSAVLDAIEAARARTR